MQVWNVLHAARWKCRTQKNHQKVAIWAPLHNFVELYLRNEGTYQQLEKNLLNSNIYFTCSHNVVNFGPLAAEICWRVWGTPANFNGFRVLAALLHGTLVVGVSQTLRHWTEGATYIRRGGHHVGHWPTFLVILISDIRQPAKIQPAQNDQLLSCLLTRHCIHSMLQCTATFQMTRLSHMQLQQWLYER